MNKLFTSLCFLCFIVTLSFFPALIHFIPVYAQQHDSLASAAHLDTTHPASVVIPAYASEYLYFFIPANQKNIPQITLSKLSHINIQIFDSRGTQLRYTKASSQSITFHETMAAKERYFLKLSNQSSQTKKLTISLTYPEKAKKDEKKAKPKKSPNNKINSKTVKPNKTAKNKKNGKTANSKKSLDTKNTTKKNKITKSGKSTKPVKSPGTKKTDKTAANPNSKSNFSLSTHFLRIKSGHSLSLPEHLQLSGDLSKLSFQAVSPDKVSIQNGILYAREPGISVIIITAEHFKSSCTICIQ